MQCRKIYLTVTGITLLGLGLGLGACGNPTVGIVTPGNGGSNGGGGGGGTTPTSPTVSIDSFSVQGTNGTTAISRSGATPGTAFINGDQNNGAFSVSWMTTTDSGAVERITVALSISAQGAASADQLILDRNCNLPGTDCSSTTALFQCRFDFANMQVDCPVSGTSSSDTYPVGNYFANNGGLPGNYFLVMQACVNDSGGNPICDMRSLPLTVQ